MVELAANVVRGTAAVVLALAVGACAARPASSTSGEATGSVTVYAAASLTLPMRAIKSAYEAARPGTTVSVSTDSSAALGAKIEQGAPADVLLAADTATPTRLVDRGLADGDVTAIASNSLALVVPASNPARITTPADLARPGIKVIAGADSVPIAAYTARLVANLAAQPAYPTDFAARYAANVASKETNVSAILTKVELGEGDAGVVYATDARGSTKTTTIPIAAAANVAAVYGAIVVKASPRVAAGRAFLAWLAGSEGQAVLGSFGFGPPS